MAAEEQRLPCVTGVSGECQLCSRLGEVLCDYTERSGLARPKPVLSDLAHSSSFLCLQILLRNSQSALLYAGYCSEYWTYRHEWTIVSDLRCLGETSHKVMVVQVLPSLLLGAGSPETTPFQVEM